VRRVATALSTTAIVLLAVLPACNGDGAPGAGEAQLEVDGVAVVSSGGQSEQVTDSRTISFGDKVEITKGTARLRLPGALRLELRAALEGADNSIVTVDATPVLEAGDALVRAEGTGSVEAAGTVVTVEDGAARMSRFLGMAVATYAGAATLDSAGQTRSVPALRQMQVSTLGRPPQTVRPFDYVASDPWDRRFLGAAMDFGEELRALAGAYTSSLSPGEGRSVGFYEAKLAALEGEPAFAGLLAARKGADVGDNLIGAATALLAVHGTFAERWHGVFDFKDQGAEWGLVVLDQGVSEGPLRGLLRGAVDRTSFAFGPAPATQSTTPVSVPSGPTPTTTTTAPPPTTTTTTPPPAPPPDDSPVGTVTRTVEELLGGLLGP
jgi:hypothetical protein